MPSRFTTAARVAANRRNSKRATGPRTTEGKERSRANAVKHGLTGAGIALPAEDRVVVEERFRTIQAELEPTTVIGAALVHQVALMTVRLQRSARCETAALAERIRRAASDFDEARHAEADRLFASIETEPITNRRRLRAMPEGVDRLVEALLGLRAELAQGAVGWTRTHETKIEAYLGRRYGEVPRSRVYRLSLAIGGDFTAIDADEIANLTTLPDRRAWAADRLIECIDAEVASLQAHRDTLDPEAVALDRAEAGARALFDPGKEATLARKYEAAASRDLFRCLREFRAVEELARSAGPELVRVDREQATRLDGEDLVGAPVGSAHEPEPDSEPKPLPPNSLARGWVRLGTRPVGRRAGSPARGIPHRFGRPRPPHRRSSGLHRVENEAEVGFNPSAP